MKKFNVTAEVRFCIDAVNDYDAKIRAGQALAIGNQSMEDAFRMLHVKGVDLVCVTEESRLATTPKDGYR